MNSFLNVVVEKDNRGKLKAVPCFISKGKDFMMKGSEFYAIYDERTGLWNTSMDDAIDIIDERMYAYVKERYNELNNGTFITEEGVKFTIGYLHVSSSHQLKAFRDWIKSLPPNHNYHQLDQKITFMDDKPSMKDYRTKRLEYKVEPGSTANYDLFMNTCYAPEEREKLEWAVGSILCGDSVKLQKFIAVYGRPGTGKSTFFNIVQDLLEGYWSVIDVDALVSRSNAFGTAALKDNPLLCIQHDADLSRIEKNDVLNSIVSHEKITINEKYSKQYTMKLNAMIFIGTNEMVNISDMRQGITRRMIDVYPTGNVLSQKEYNSAMKGIKFELGAIAYHCMKVYQEVDHEKYMKYRPSTMIQKTNIYTNFANDRFIELSDEANDPISATSLYKMFKEWMTESGYEHIPPISKFKEAMLDFYDDYKERHRVNGRQLRSVFIGFKKDGLSAVLEYKTVSPSKADNTEDKFGLAEVAVGAGGVFMLSTLDRFLKDYPAQLSNSHGVPSVSWDKCKTLLHDISPFEEHYVKVPENLIVIDFDLKGEDGKKSYEKNLAAIQSWPLTYAETSKSGAGIHLHYIYDGDVSGLSRVYDEGIEVKVYTGNSALRRKLAKCNNLPITHISSGLPLREEGKSLVKDVVIKNEKALRTIIVKNLKKEYHPGTKPSIDFIYKVLDDAYRSGISYDVSDLEGRITAFANNSTNHANYCLGIVGKMKFQSDDVSEFVSAASDTIVFFDIEIFPNVFIVCWKEAGEGKKVHRMINPRPSEVEALFKYKLVGFNNRKYDNHMLWARTMGYTAEGLYDLSNKLIHGDPKEQLAASFSEAYNLSYADVFDFAKQKQSLKKWEIELGIHHLENSYPWDEALPEDKWDEVADYCCNDVIATEAVFDHCHTDFVAREVLADLSGLTVNHTTRQHATKIIFGDDKHPELVYTDLSKLFPGYKFDKFGIDPSEYNGYDPEDKKTWHIGGKSVYMGEDPSEGGFVRAEPGMYFDVGLLDIASMHPSSIIALNLFGKHTKRYEDLVTMRLCIKHGDFETARGMFDGRLAKWLDDEEGAAKLADALKLVINSVYGFTSATFENPFKDAKNVDNIVAKRGALFMIKLKKTLEEMGVRVIHVKTDSIKVPNITPEIVSFVQEFGRKYGYNFEHESTYEKMCLVNGSTYIAKVASGKHAGEWVAVAAQFQHPYVFKTLFSKEELKFEDFCEIKEVKSNMVLDFNEDIANGEHRYEYIGKIGSFIPVREGFGGGILLRDKADIWKKAYDAWKENPFDSKGKPKPEPNRYGSVTGADGYRWLNAEVVKGMPNWKDMVDMRYYQTLVDDAIETISQYGDFDQFINYRNVVSEDFPPDDELPF